MVEASVFFENVRKAVINEENLRERRMMAYDRMISISGVEYNDTPRAASPDADSMAAAISRYHDIVAKMEEEEEIVAIMVHQACTALDAMRIAGHDPEVVSEAEFYFCWGLSTKEVAKKCYRSESSVRNRRAALVAEAQPFIPMDAA